MANTSTPPVAESGSLKSGSLNMDRRLAVFMDTGTIQWEPSPAAGVWRRKIERKSRESGQTTSLVRYESGTSFKPHVHPQGEEFLVIDGIFEDNHGSYGAGTYVRNPPGSSHRPASPAGCTLFVKLCMFDPRDTERVVHDTRDDAWLQRDDGAAVQTLHRFGSERTDMLKLSPGPEDVRLDDPGGTELLVIAGVMNVAGKSMGPGCWLRSPPGSRLVVRSDKGALVLIKSGHLSRLIDLDTLNSK